MKNSAAESEAGAVKDAVFQSTKSSSSSWKHGSGCRHSYTWRRIVKFILFFLGVTVMSAVLYSAATPFGTLMPISYYFTSFKEKNVDPKLESILKNASMSDGTVILTTVNDAWAEPDSIFDLFLESFHVGEGTEKLLKHVVVITYDQKAYSRCITLHPHCYLLPTKGDNFSSEAFFMTSDYLHMMWRRIEFLGTILDMGHSFLFTDSDIMWLRDPFRHFFKDADFQIACDFFKGNSYDRNNNPNGGFTYVRSNQRTVSFYKFWYASRNTYPQLHDQDVLNKIKKHPFLSRIKLRLRFLDTAYFGGFCQSSKDFKKVCTMHANCCVGLDNKIHDLKILLQDWNNYYSLPSDRRAKSHPHWTVPKSCRGSFKLLKSHENGKRG